MIIDDAVGVRVSIAYKKVDDNVDEKSNLPGNVKDEELLLQSSEESELQWSKE